jgi:hypothetical protein
MSPCYCVCDRDFVNGSCRHPTRLISAARPRIRRMQSPMRICPAFCKEQDVHRPTADPAFLVARDALALDALALVSYCLPKATGISETLGIVLDGQRTPKPSGVPGSYSQKPTTGTRSDRSRGLPRQARQTEEQGSDGNRDNGKGPGAPADPPRTSPSGLVRSKSSSPG